MSSLLITKPYLKNSRKRPLLVISNKDMIHLSTLRVAHAYSDTSPIQRNSFMALSVTKPRLTHSQSSWLKSKYTAADHAGATGGDLPLSWLSKEKIIWTLKLNNRRRI
jgi:hypothetical protein